MNTRFPLLLASVLAFCQLAGAAPSQPRLAGLVNLDGAKWAIIEPADSTRGWDRYGMLREGQREADLELVRIDPDKGQAEVRLPGTTPVTLNLSSDARLPVRGFVLEDVDIIPALQLYAEAAHRTVLHGPFPSGTSLTLTASVTNRADVARALEKALAQQDFISLPDGDKFLILVPKGMESVIKPRSAEIKTSGQEPGGFMHFRNAGLSQVLTIYAEYSHHKLDRRQRLPFSAPITLKTQPFTSPSRAEAVYALDVVLRLHGLKVELSAEDLVKAVRVSDEGR